MGAIRIKSINTAQKSSIRIKRKHISSEDSSAVVSLKLIKGNKKITQSRKIYDALLPNSGTNQQDIISIHLHKLNEEFLGLRKAFIFDEISMDIKVNNSPIEKITRKKIVMTKKS